jgi:hypothetical protein
MERVSIISPRSSWALLYNNLQDLLASAVVVAADGHDEVLVVEGVDQPVLEGEIRSSASSSSGVGR